MAPDHVPGDLETPLAGPAGRQARRYRADLAADQAYAPTVKVAAQIDCRWFAPVP